jgi:hypothetical protein
MVGPSRPQAVPGGIFRSPGTRRGEGDGNLKDFPGGGVVPCAGQIRGVQRGYLRNAFLAEAGVDAEPGGAFFGVFKP